MIFGNVTGRSRVHGVVSVYPPPGKGPRLYKATMACGKQATLKRGTLESTVPCTGDEPDAVDCKRCREKLHRLSPGRFPQR